MNFYWRLLICSFVGFVLQVLLFFVMVTDWSLRKMVFGVIYSPWVELGKSLDRSSAGGGHAMQGGVILAIILGVLFYSLLIGLAGAVIWNFKKRQLSK